TIMPHPNAKSRITSNKNHNKDGIFAAEPEITNNIEENMDFPEDWELFEVIHEIIQNYALKAIE
ncbi:4913_t:CDS:1, partial [Cetraspora pellucida]